MLYRCYLQKMLYVIRCALRNKETHFFWFGLRMFKPNRCKWGWYKCSDIESGENGEIFMPRILKHYFTPCFLNEPTPDTTNNGNTTTLGGGAPISQWIPRVAVLLGLKTNVNVDIGIGWPWRFCFRKPSDSKFFRWNYQRYTIWQKKVGQNMQHMKCVHKCSLVLSNAAENCGHI